MTDDLRGVDDWIADLAIARRALNATWPTSLTLLCRRRFTHPHRPAEIDAIGPVINTCACLRVSGHDRGCLCEHDIERLV